MRSKDEEKSWGQEEGIGVNGPHEGRATAYFPSAYFPQTIPSTHHLVVEAIMKNVQDFFSQQRNINKNYIAILFLKHLE